MQWFLLAIFAITATTVVLALLRHQMVNVEPFRISITRHTVSDPDLPDHLEGLTICQVSDLHITAHGRNKDAIAEALRSVTADLYVLTGDMIYLEAGIPVFLSWFDALGDKIRPCIAIQGNAEHKPYVNAKKLLDGLEAREVPVLNNAVHCFPWRGSALQIVGVDDPVTAYDNFDRAYASASPNAWTLLLCHTPEGVLKMRGKRADLMLTGHTHGGQVRFPIIGAVFNNTRYVKGLVMGWYGGDKLSDKAKFDVGKTRLYVSRGLGMSRFPGRLLCQPEIALFTLTKQA